MTKDWVVVVDDDPISLKNARELLGSEDLRISALRSGRELLTFMERHEEPDLVILDVLMPEMDGFEAYRRLRAQEERLGRRQIPVFFLTGDNDSESEQLGLQLGAADYIHKPFDRDVLLHRIRNTILNNKTIENLTEEASVDQLTGFLNKSSGTLKTEELCRTAQGAMMVIDLDSFKLVNDLYGHDMGDQVLRSFSAIVRQASRSGDVLTRIGGDEFLAFYKNVEEETAVAALTRRMNDQLEGVCRELMGEDFGIPIGASVGCVLVPAHGRDYQILFQLADKALYQVKQNGKHGYVLHVPGKDAEGSGETHEDLTAELARMTKLIEERSEAGSAMWLGQEAFAWIYRFMLRFFKRHEGVMSKLYFSITMKEEGTEEDSVRQAELFGETLRKVLRKSDVILQCRQHQFFVLLPELEERYIPNVIRRLEREWARSGFLDRSVVDYAMESVDFRKGGNDVD